MNSHADVIARGEALSTEIYVLSLDRQNLGKPEASAHFLLLADWTAFVTFAAHHTGRDVNAALYTAPIIFNGITVKRADLVECGFDSADNGQRSKMYRDWSLDPRNGRHWKV